MLMKTLRQCCQIFDYFSVLQYIDKYEENSSVNIAGRFDAMAAIAAPFLNLCRLNYSLLATLKNKIMFYFQLALKQTADSHIFKFLKNKIFRDPRDFETQLYLCNEAFKE
jgi:Q-cell neuroblast polarisation